MFTRSSVSASRVLCATAVLCVGGLMCRWTSLLLGAMSPLPHMPVPPVSSLDEDGRVMGWIKRRLFRHFYILRRKEALMQLVDWGHQYAYRPFIMQIFLRSHVVLSSPLDVEEVLLRQEAKFYKHTGYDLVRCIIGDGLLPMGNKAKHIQHRKTLAPFFCSRNIRAISNEITRMHVLWALARLCTDILDHDGASIEVDVTAWTNEMTLSVIGEAAFRLSRRESLRVREAFDAVLTVHKMNYFCPYLRTRTQREAERTIATLADALVECSLRERVWDSRPAFIDILVDELHRTFSPEDVINHILTILFAGHDTTSHTIQFLLALLGTHPPVQEALFQSLLELMPNISVCPTVEELLECPYLVAVAQETMRLFPAAPILYRDALEDVYLPASRVVIPTGTTSVISIFSLHRNEDVYGADTSSFRPERWLGEEGKQLRSSCGRCGFIPFSCGTRNCIGQEFGFLETLLTAAVLIRHTRVRLVGAFPETRYVFTLTTKKPVHLQVALRPGVDRKFLIQTITQAFLGEKSPRMPFG